MRVSRCRGSKGHKYVRDLVAEAEVSINHDRQRWNEIFDEFLLFESNEGLEKLLEYVQSSTKPHLYIWADVLEVLKTWKSDNLLAVLGEAIPELDVEMFERIFKIISRVMDSDESSSVTPLGIAKLVLAILEKSSNLPHDNVARLQTYIYQREWPCDWEVGLILLRIERFLNELLVDDRTFFADQVPDTDSDIGNAIAIEKLLIRGEWPMDDAIFDLPYEVKEYLGDETDAEEELLSLLDESEEYRELAATALEHFRQLQGYEDATTG